MQVLEKMIETLSEIRDLLLKHGFPGQGAFIDRLIDTAQEDREGFAAGVSGGAVWGGAGAVWEVGTFKGHRIPDAEAGKDEALFRKAITRLAEEMDEAGIGTARSRDIAGILKYWQDMGL